MTAAFLGRERFRRRYRANLYKNIHPLDNDELSKSAVIFSPHPDDETLACGGTIIKKLAAGADVSVLFMTLGRNSHSGLISGDQLEQMRRSEAESAGASLGLREENLHFLDFEDGELVNNIELAVSKTVEIIERFQPQSVFLPCREEKPSDHRATRQVALSVFDKLGKRVQVYEYPLWFWQHWPLTPIQYRRRREIPGAWVTSAISGFKAFTDFRHGVNIEDVLQRKRVVLDEYESQMTSLDREPGWKTLADVSAGDFLECFFQRFELFRRYEL